MRKIVPISVFLAVGLILTGCTSDNPNPKPTEQIQENNVPTEYEVDILLGEMSVNGVNVTVRQVAFGHPTGTQLERLLTPVTAEQETEAEAGTETPSEEATEPSDEVTTEEDTQVSETDSKPAGKAPRVALDKDYNVVSLEYVVTNTTDTEIHLGSLGFGMGFWDIGSYLPPEGTELTPENNDIGLVDYSSSDDTLHSRLGFKTFQDDNAYLASGGTASVIIDILVPQSINTTDKVEATFMTFMTYEQVFSEQQNFVLTIKK